ncbi:Gfo/Idh/MocA family protein [Saliterribacillus persicus]|uniref:Putative dehydrogenase n=1 Tax=Saliterribacillus persicus TaxID=930114 RepID=A0A368Y4Y3_9BACI|nr:Gfo/Idh/MocA family oxidoreductase [Saliterribacillus persicus]RCW74799.1 putative dehydrogenase [Saliterribacillus persicus]
MTKEVSVLLVGIGGYGNMYAKTLLESTDVSAYVKGVVEINPKHAPAYQTIMDKNIPIYNSIEDFYEEQEADLAIISTPIHLHKDQACYAMEHGSHVLCEKPVTANPEHLTEMKKSRDKTGKFLAIGFNWSFTKSVQSLKQDILNGEFGKPLSMKSLVLWPRNEDYYNRSSWAGKKYSANGDMIFDSVANNATAHFLHHLFYLSGEKIDQSATIQSLTAELYRANPIETFDTCAVKIKTTNNVDITYLASHAVEKEYRPKYTLTFENAMIKYHPDGSTSDIIVEFKDGTVKKYEDPEHNHLEKLTVCIEAIKHNHKDILCGLEAASSHVNAIYAMHQSVKEIPVFPNHWIAYDDERKLTTVQGLSETLKQCYRQESLPNELGVEWSEIGETITFS